VLFRHEKRFENPPGFAIFISDTMDAAEIDARLERFNSLRYERVGLNLRPEMAALKCESGDAGRYTALVEKVRQKSDAAIILMSEDAAVLAAALEVCAGNKPLLYAATKNNIDAFAALAKEKACPLAVKADDIDGLIELTTKLEQSGIKDIVIDSGARTLKQVFEDQVAIRRAALEKKFRPLGYSTIIRLTK
jgi:acetyl-CoA decarbonylase/synthase complex subunit gamma